MANEATPSVERLLSESVWLASLARALLGRDEDAVDDVVQEARLAALQSAPADPEHARAWLARVTRNFALRVRLRRTRRERREQAAAAPEAQPSTLDLVARVNAQRRVAAAVVALDEPYRSVVLLRWFDALPVKDVAERLGVPVETVRTRLKRALARLREQLDASFGARDAWAGMLLPWAVPGGGAATTAAAAAKAAAGTTAVVGAGVLTMSLATKSMLAAAACVVAAAVAWQLLPDLAGPSSASASRRMASGAAVDGAPAANATVDGAGRVGGSDATRSTEPAAAAESDAARSLQVTDVVSVTVLSAADDRPLRDAELRITITEYSEKQILEHLLGSARTDADGRAEVKLPAGSARGQWDVFADGFVPGGGSLFEVPPVLHRHDLGIVKLARGTRVHGRVMRGPDRRPVAGAELRFDRSWSGWLVMLDEVHSDGTSAADGSFTLLERISAPSQKLQPLFALSDEGLGIGVFRVPAGAEEVEGVEVVIGDTARVVVSIRDDAGAPIEGADVCCIPRFSPFSPPLSRGVGQEFLTLRDSRLAAIFNARTDAAGIATFARLPMAPNSPVLEIRDAAATRYFVAVRVDDHEMGASDEIRVDPAATTRCDLVLPRIRIVSVVGKVTAPDGEPIPDAEIDAWANPTKHHCTSDEHGEFRVDGLSTSTRSVYLQVSAPGRRKFEQGFAFEGLALVPLLDEHGAPLEARRVDVVLERTVRIAGRLVDEAGAPVVGARVTYSPSLDGVLQMGPIDVETPGSDAEGRFDHPATESEWTVIAYAPLEDGTFGPGVMRVVKGGATDLVLTCITRPARAARVTCEVVDAASGAAVPVAKADVVPAEGFVGNWNVWKRCALGSVVARGLFAGRWRVDVELADHRRASQEFTIASDHDDVRVRVEVGMSARVVGRVELDAALAASSRFPPRLDWDPSEVRLVDADGRILSVSLPAHAELGGDRRFILDGFVPGQTARVRFTDFDRLFDEVVFTPSRGEVREIVLRPGLAAHLRWKSGIDVSKGYLNIDLATDDEPWHREFWLIHVAADANEPVHTIRPGHYRWRAFFHPDANADEPPHVTTASGEFDVAAGSTHELRIDELR